MLTHITHISFLLVFLLYFLKKVGIVSFALQWKF